MASEENKESSCCFDDNFDPFAQGTVSKETNGNISTSKESLEQQSKNYLATLGE